MPNNCSGSTRLSSYYAGAGIIPLGTVGYPYGVRTNIPVYGRLALSNFYGAAYDAGQIINGDFEIVTGITEDNFRYNLLGWKVLKQVTRLAGNAQILNCFTPGLTVSPTPAPPAGFSSPGDNVTFSTNLTNNPSYSVRILDTSNPLYSSLAVPGGTGKYIVELKNSGVFAGVVSQTNPNAFGIMRGPIMISDNSFAFTTGDQITFNWRAAKDPQGDTYAVMIYLLNTQTCGSIVLLDTYGTNSGWQTVNYTLTNGALAGQYRVVVVHGSYDSAGGMKVGAYLYLDNFTLTKFTLAPGQTTTTSTSTTTTTQSYTYNGNEALYVSPGVFNGIGQAQGGQVFKYKVNIFDNFKFGVTGAQPGNRALIETVTGFGQNNNLWLPGPLHVNPTGTNYNPIAPNGDFTYSYEGLTVRLPDSSEQPSSLYYSAVVSGLGTGGLKAIELEVTTPISVLAESAPTVASLGYNPGGYAPATRIIFEGDQVTFTVRDTRALTGTFFWRLQLFSGWTGIVNTENYFQGGTAGTYPLSGQVVMNSGVGQITIKTQEISIPNNPRIVRMEIWANSLVTGRRVSFVDSGLVDKNYQGQVEFTTPGTHTWIAPTGVYSVNVVAVGAGGGGGFDPAFGGSGGGGSLTYVNQIPVVPGQAYTVIVGAGGTAGNATVSVGGEGGLSLFGFTSTLNTANVLAYGGHASNGYRTYGSLSGSGLGGLGSGASFLGGFGAASGGGGGAAGYAGQGGTGNQSNGSNGNGGGGGGGSMSTSLNVKGDGGGVGILGQGGNGAGGIGGAADPSGSAGSGGLGRTYGGGGGGARGPATQANPGGGGAVRIIWGRNRTFPSINAGNMPTIT